MVIDAKIECFWQQSGMRIEESQKNSTTEG